MATDLTEADWQTILLDQIHVAVADDPYWGARLVQPMESHPHPFAIHLAVFTEPYLRYVMEGHKTIESRFGVNRCPPFHRVKAGDVILLKRSAGPIIGLCQVSYAWFYELDPKSWDEIRTQFTQALCAQDPTFCTERHAATHATLMRIDHVLAIEPVGCGKRDRRGWVVLSPDTRQLEMEALVP